MTPKIGPNVARALPNPDGSGIGKPVESKPPFLHTADRLNSDNRDPSGPQRLGQHSESTARCRLQHAIASMKSKIAPFGSSTSCRTHLSPILSPIGVPRFPTDAYPSDMTIGFEIELIINDLLGREKASWHTSAETAELVERIRKAVPRHWEVMAVSGNVLEVRTTRNRRTPYYANRPLHWTALLRGIKSLQRLFPRKLFSMHMHVGRKSLTSGDALYVGPIELAQRIKVFEAQIRAWYGKGYTSPASSSQVLVLGDDALLPYLHRRVDRYRPTVRDKLGMINVRQESPQPTLEFRIIDGLMNETGLLDIRQLAQRARLGFALIQSTRSAKKADAAEKVEKTLPLASLGIPAVAGQKPSAAQWKRFAEVLFPQDRIAQALAKSLSTELAEVVPGLNSNALRARQAELRKLYQQMGLEVVYELHARCEGYDPHLFARIAGDEALVQCLAHDLFVNGMAGFIPELLGDDPVLAPRLREALAGIQTRAPGPPRLSGEIPLPIELMPGASAVGSEITQTDQDRNTA